MSLPASSLGEALDADDRAYRLTQVRSADLGGLSAMALQNEKSPEVLDALLAGLAAGNSEATEGLGTHVEDPRVRPALIRALDSPKYDRRAVGNIAQLVGFVGGKGALPALRRHLAKQARWPRTGKDSENLSRTRGVFADAILRLDPDDTAAARVLVSLIDDPRWFVSWFAIYLATNHLERPLATTAHGLLARRLERLLDEGSARAVLAGGMFLVRAHPERVLRLVEPLLDHDDWSERMKAAYFLARPEAHGDGTSFRRLLTWVRSQPLLVVLQVAETETAAARMPPPMLLTIVRRALADPSPWLRHRATNLLPHVPRPTARLLARRAIGTEPDPALRRILQRLAARV